MLVPKFVDCNWAQLRELAVVVIAFTLCGAHVGHEWGSRIGMCERASALRFCTGRRIISKSYSAKASCHRATWPSGYLKLFQKDWKSRLRREKKYNFSQIFGPELRRVVR